MRSLLISFAALFSVASCIHPSTTAELYQANGAFVFAAEYHAVAFEADDRSSSLELVRGIELSRSAFKEKLKKAEADGRYEVGFAVLHAWVEFEEWVARQRIQDLTRQDLGDLEKRWTRLAQQSLIDQVDALVSSGGDPLDILRALRKALALTPNDRELDARYRRLKAALSRQVRLSVHCEPSLSGLCGEVRGLWLEELSRVRRELVFDVEEGSDAFDTQLTLRIFESERYAPWSLKERRRHEIEVKVLNEFKEPILDEAGRPKVRTVQAYSAIEIASREVTVTAELDWEDLRSKASKVKRFTSKETRRSEVEFLQWKGDDRAMVSSGLLERVSKSRRDPLSKALLQRRGISSVVEDLFRQWIKEIDQ